MANEEWTPASSAEICWTSDEGSSGIVLKIDVYDHVDGEGPRAEKLALVLAAALQNLTEYGQHRQFCVIGGEEGSSN